MSELSLPDKIIAIDAALALIPHAFGGAIALGYHAEPRATIDIDINVFVQADRAEDVLEPLAQLGANIVDAVELSERDGQVRVMWGRTPIDIFFAYDRFHDEADKGAIEVPFGDHAIRVLSATHLAVCKAVFDRPKDWIDIDAMIMLDTHIDSAEALRWVGRITGDQSSQFERLAALLTNR